MNIRARPFMCRVSAEASRRRDGESVSAPRVYVCVCVCVCESVCRFIVSNGRVNIVSTISTSVVAAVVPSRLEGELTPSTMCSCVAKATAKPVCLIYLMAV